MEDFSKTQPTESPETLKRAIDGVIVRLSAIRSKADPNKNTLGERAGVNISRLEQLKEELEVPGAEFQNIQQSFVKVLEDTDSMEHEVAGKSSR